jgi:hypothetical protein
MFITHSDPFKILKKTKPFMKSLDNLLPHDRKFQEELYKLLDYIPHNQKREANLFK